MSDNPQVDRMIEQMLVDATTHALETDDFEAFMAGAEWAARRTIRLLAQAVMSSAGVPLAPEMSE